MAQTGVPRRAQAGLLESCRASAFPDARRTLDLLYRHGFERYVDQYEMVKPFKERSTDALTKP